MGIKLIGPDGGEYEIADVAKVPEAVKLGYRLADAPTSLLQDIKEGAQSAGESIKAGAIGALAGVAPGLTGAALAQPSSETPTEAKVRKGAIAEIAKAKEEHPIASGVGELAGAIASPLAGVQGRISKALGATTAIGRIGSNVVGGAAVGSLYGAGNAVTDAALGNHDLTAEKLFAGAGLGALIGGGTGAIGSSLEEGAKALMPKLGKSLAGVSDELGDWANNRALKAAGATKSDLSYLGPEKAQEVGQMLISRGHLGTGLEAPNAAGVLKSVSAEKESVGAQLGKVFEDAHDSGATPDYAAVTKRLDDFEAALSPLQRKAISGEVHGARDAAAEYAEKGLGFKALRELKQDLQAKAKWKNNIGDEFGGTLKRQLSGVVRDELDSQLMPHLGSDVAKSFTDNNKLYGLLSDAERVAEHGSERLGGNASFGLRDLGMGAAAGLGQGNPVTGVIAAIASKTLRERGQGVIARLADSIVKSPRLSVAAESLGKQMQAAAPFMGQYAAPLAAAFAQSPAEGLATHMVYAQVDPHYQDAAQKGGFLPETPEETAHAMTKAGSIAAIQTAIQKHDKDNDTAIKAIFKGEKAPKPSAAMDSQDFGSKRMRRDARDSHDQRISEIRQLATDPGALLDRMTKNLGGLSDVAPNVSQAMTKTAYSAVQYLAKQAEQPPKAGPLAPDWVQSEAEMHAFSQKLEAVQDPASTLRHAAARTLTQDQVDAVAAVYPGWYHATSQKMLTDAMAHPSMPYASRLMVAIFTGVDLDGSLGTISATQSAIAASNASSPNPNQVDSGKSPMTVAQRTAMPSEAKAMKEA